MRKKLLLAVIVMAMSGTLVQAQERQLFKISVPFSFTAEDTAFPAGSYIVYSLNPYNLLRLQSADGRHLTVVRSVASPKFAASSTSGLVFARINGRLFLTAVQEHGANIHRELMLGNEAREMLAEDQDQHGYTSSVTVSAR